MAPAERFICPNPDSWASWMCRTSRGFTFSKSQQRASSPTMSLPAYTFFGWITLPGPNGPPCVRMVVFGSIDLVVIVAQGFRSIRAFFASRGNRIFHPFGFQGGLCLCCSQRKGSEATKCDSGLINQIVLEGKVHRHADDRKVEGLPLLQFEVNPWGGRSFLFIYCGYSPFFQPGIFP
jgi:hypothetical protein